jgi:hypothetical protein
MLTVGALLNSDQQPSTLVRIHFSTTKDAALWKVFARWRDAMHKIS